MGQAFEKQLGRAEVRYIGVRGRAEEVIVPKAGLKIDYVPASGYVSPRNPLGFARFAFKLFFGCLKAGAILLRFRPDFILATGGYAAAPVVMAQAVLKGLGLSKARTVLHEANAVPGKLNRLMASRVDHLFLTFPQSQSGPDSKPGRVVGYPVRGALARLDRDEARHRLGLELEPGQKLVLIFGGSQGARSINRAVVEALKDLSLAKRPPFILHAVGLGGAGHQPEAETKALLEQAHGPDWRTALAGVYRQEIYLHDMASAYSAADLVVCRAGAGAIHEVSSLGCPTLLVPKPNLPGDHQVVNARALAAVGGAEVIYEDLLRTERGLTSGVAGERLAARILNLLSEPEKLESMSAKAKQFMSDGAAARIAQVVLSPKDEPGPDSQARLLPPAPTHEGLLILLTRAFQSQPEAYSPNRLVPDPEELEYYRARSALLLLAPHWNQRNVGIKLIGLLKDESKIDHLLRVLTDRTPVGWWRRLLGGDFYQVGFIRRNALVSLVLIDRHTEALEEALLTALSDPYYEVRAQAARALARFSQRLTAPSRFQKALMGMLADKSFEVIRESALALGSVGQDGYAIEALLGLRLHRYWQVRQAALLALAELARRSIPSDPERMLQDVTGFVVTATDFRPSFTIKGAYRELVEELTSMTNRE
jgi:UDP-N-acetylglucosamine--N-acetylmuramyl-(pentapeptide) pyrophosphoryl-undecaprenol N-acetylglucosamine transferase